MTSGPLLLYHLGLLLLPLAALALMRFRLTPAVLLVAVLHHHPMDPLPGDQDPPPLCCALAQSIEAEPGLTVVRAARTFRLRAFQPSSPPDLAKTAKPAIRAPPFPAALPPPEPWAPVFRAA